jgi:hypothetical protein
MNKCRCGKIVEQDRKKCALCLKTEKDRAAAKRKYRKENGLCIECDNLVQAGLSRCSYHLEKERQKNEKYRDRQKCLKCGKKESECDFPFMPPHNLCAQCHTLFIPYIERALKRFLRGRKGSGKKSWVTRRKHIKP